MSLGGQETPRSATTPALAFVEGLERCQRAGVTELVLLIEEPELFLRPPAQRFLYRQLRAFAAAGNQVLYSTHSSAFLNVARLDEIVLVEHRENGTKVFRPEPLAADDSFRAMSEFDAERSELFLSRVALLVEGRTEKTAFPFLFKALGYDVDREGISIVECGGKPNIPLFARVCSATGVPFLVLHDRDATHLREPIPAERAVNAAIRTAAGAERTVILTPDFESVVGLAGRRRKPERAFRNLTGVRRAEVPAQLVDLVERMVALARR
jgi:predicted ATP-dependent endonuclease of OLD family